MAEMTFDKVNPVTGKEQSEQTPNIVNEIKEALAAQDPPAIGDDAKLEPLPDEPQCKGMVVHFKASNPAAVLPAYAHYGDAGLDLVAVDCIYNQEYDYFEYNTGLQGEIPFGYVGLLFPRSSNSKTEAYLCNSVGVDDSIYRGDIKLRFKNRDRNCKFQPYECGKAIAQLIILPYPTIIPVWADELSETERGEGGFGSTDKKD